MFSNLTHYHIHRPGVSLPPLVTPYDYVLAANGLFVRAASPLLAVVIPITPERPQSGLVRGLAELAPRLQIGGGLLPASFLSEMVRDARRRHTPGQPRAEQLYRVLVGDDGKRHLIHPRQQGSAAQVSTAGDGGPRVLAEIHTHGDTAAYWSPTDNADELGFRFYGVLGRVGSAQPEMRLRVGLYGYFWEVSVCTLFDSQRCSPNAALACGAGEGT